MELKIQKGDLYYISNKSDTYFSFIIRDKVMYVYGRYEHFLRCLIGNTSFNIGYKKKYTSISKNMRIESTTSPVITNISSYIVIERIEIVCSKFDISKYIQKNYYVQQFVDALHNGYTTESISKKKTKHIFNISFEFNIVLYESIESYIRKKELEDTKKKIKKLKKVGSSEKVKKYSSSSKSIDAYNDNVEKAFKKVTDLLSSVHDKPVVLKKKKVKPKKSDRLIQHEIELFNMKKPNYIN